MTKIVLIGNYKGGVGKTTSTFNFAAAFAEKGKRVLVLDLDPQGSLSEIMTKRGEFSLDKLEDEETLNYVLDSALLKLEHHDAGLELRPGDNLIKQFSADNRTYFCYIPSSPFYRKGYMGLDVLVERMTDDVVHLSILKKYLDTVRDNYDYILIDTPPSNTLLTRSAVLLSDYYVVPTILDGLSTNGITHYIETVSRTYRKYCAENADAIVAKQIFGKETELIGIFCNLRRKPVNYGDAYQNLKKALNDIHINEDKIMQTRVDMYVDIARNTEGGYVSLSPSGFSLVAQELFNRLEQIV